jgi:hypothetical protein
MYITQTGENGDEFKVKLGTVVSLGLSNTGLGSFKKCSIIRSASQPFSDPVEEFFAL